MRVIKAASALILILALAIGTFSIFSHIASDSNVVNLLKKDKIGGTRGFHTDFSGVTLVPTYTNYQVLVDDNTGNSFSSTFITESDKGDIFLKDEKLQYVCKQTHVRTEQNAQFKLRPNYNDEKVRLSDIKFLTFDFDIDFDCSSESKISGLLNIRSVSSNETVVGDVEYFKFPEYGSGHYTFILYDEGAENVSCFVYLNGEYVTTIKYEFSESYNADDFCVGNFNLNLPRTEADVVSIDNVDFYYFDEEYTGPMADFIINFDEEATLFTCKDSVLYKR